MNDKTIVILSSQGESGRIIYNSLKDDFHIEKVIIEKPVPKSQFLKKRIKKLGFFKVFGQVLFQLIVISYLNMASRNYMIELKKNFGLNSSPIDVSKIINVSSVNSDETINILKDLNPDIIVICGTRIIADRVINCISAKFVNMHAGITPLYRGVHGAYWALVDNNIKLCGVTVHFVDAGIDTGNIIEQILISPTKNDNFVTYPLLQIIKGIPLLKKVIRDIFDNRVTVKSSPSEKSRLWSHPTLWEYIWNRFNYGVK